MLAPFFTNLLIVCLALLFAGWVLDFLNGWFGSVRQSVSHANRSVSGPGTGFKTHMPVCAGYEIHSNALLQSGMTKSRKNA